jgi:uncharacterized protein DUF6285
MRDKPQADDLLKIAELTFMQEILPYLPADKKYTALMIANAMRIAARQFDKNEIDETVEIEALTKLLGHMDVSDDPDTLLMLNKQFAVAIRAGAFAPETAGHSRARQHLLSCVQNRLAEVNPKALNGGDDDR